MFSCHHLVWNLKQTIGDKLKESEMTLNFFVSQHKYFVIAHDEIDFPLIKN